jgi:hypothetical protein
MTCRIDMVVGMISSPVLTLPGYPCELVVDQKQKTQMSESWVGPKLNLFDCMPSFFGHLIEPGKLYI